MAKAKPPKVPTSFNSGDAVGGHAASPPGLASAHKKRTPEEQRAGRPMAQVEKIEADNAELAHGNAVAVPSHQGLANSRTPSAEADKRSADTARYKALAREHGADLSEEGFNEVLRKVGRPK